MGAILTYEPRARGQIPCREVIDLLDAYLDRSLPAVRRRRFERHLGACEACRRYLAEYEATVRLGRQAFVESEFPAPEALIDAILSVCRKA